MTFHKTITINIPQMAIEALSENWLFKETGSIHWDMICDGLNTKSFDLKDDLENRLYATFIRIKIQCSSSLRDFGENSTLEISGNMNRYGNSMYHSTIQLEGDHKNIKAELLTSFSIRNDADNSKLVKSQPATACNAIAEYDSIPAFADEYRLVKKKVLNEIDHDGFKFIIQDESIFETIYSINPFYELNGVGLLYFASYPIINDYCEAQKFNKDRKGKKKWEQSFYTVFKDVFYFANCNLEDEIIYKLHSFEHIGNNQIKLCSSLYRKNDNILLARIFSIKQTNSQA